MTKISGYKYRNAGRQLLDIQKRKYFSIPD